MVSKAALIAETGAADDGTLEDLITRATAFVERQTGRYFGAPKTVSYVLRGQGDRDLWLPEPPTDPESDPSEVVARCYPGADGTTITRGADDGFEVRLQGTRAKLVRKGGCRWRLDYEYEAEVEIGYEEDEGPGDVRQLVLALCSVRLNTRGNEGLSAETLGDYALTKPAIHAFDDGDLRSIHGAQATIRAWRRSVYA